jgi:hypothetical protein
MITFLKKHQDDFIAAFFFILLFNISLFINFFAIFLKANYSIEEKEQQDLHFIVASSVALLTILSIAYLYYKLSKASYKMLYAIAVTTPLFYNIYILVLVIPRFIDKSSYYEPFKMSRWDENKPLKMARKLCKDKSLVGISQDSLTTMLGWGKPQRWNETHLEYEISAKNCYLVVKIQNNIVTDAHLYEWWK